MPAVLPEKIVDDALELPAEVRFHLVGRLLESLNPAPPDGIEQAWAAECEQRISAVDRGDAELIPGETVFADLRLKYGIALPISLSNDLTTELHGNNGKLRLP